MKKEAFSYANLSNAAFIDELFQEYKKNPDNVDPSWRYFFQGLEFSAEAGAMGLAAPKTEGDVKVFRLIQAYRMHGHLAAEINPLNGGKIPKISILELKTHGLDEGDLDQSFSTFGILPKPQAPLKDILAALKSMYCKSLGIEYMGLGNLELEQFIQEKIESHDAPGGRLTKEDKLRILKLLNRSETFESFIHMKYPGQKRFSLEGGESLIPMMAAALDRAAEMDMKEAVIGMAHRGRLNVLANILGKSYAMVFHEFEDHYIPNSFEGSGDVKYHKGFRSKVQTFSGKSIEVSISPNPSHLESVDPVLEGYTRAKLEQEYGTDAYRKIMPILVHGDASLAGQGVVYETMQMWNLEGYRTGGTLHIVVNNQVGFTAEPDESRSTVYCTDIAKSFNAPVLHVNGEDPEMCYFAAKLAAEIRQKFHIEVFLDIYCYRKYGHNETDEPSFTQPLLYRKIKERKNIREMYRDRLIEQGSITQEEAGRIEQEFHQELEEALSQVKQKQEAKGQKQEPQKKDLLAEVPTAVEKGYMAELAEKICTLPDNFALHPKLQRILSQRKKMVQAGEEEKSVDWAMAEALAFASILESGHFVRLSGQDSGRGTFSQRHAVLTDQNTAERYIPLNHLSKDQAKFCVQNSLLSEYAAMAFELGYNYANIKALVLWEGQFGDFANGAQIVIDQYIASGEQKWNWPNSLVLLLPHGFEGQGPEHSSARMERFLQLAANDNMQIVNPTTPAQLFHSLRRQVLRDFAKPLILFTPKGLLRYPPSLSAVKDFTAKNFEEIIDDPSRPQNAARVLLCTGKVYYDLTEEREKRGRKDVAIVRIEQPYPLHLEKLRKVINCYPQAKEYFWVQEEHKNAGVWQYISPILQRELPEKATLRYVGRKESASTAAGSQALHKAELAEFLNEAYS